MIYCLVFILGIIAGIISNKLLMDKRNIGALVIDSSDMDGPYFFLELSKNIVEIGKNKKVLVNVKSKSYISQK